MTKITESTSYLPSSLQWHRWIPVWRTVLTPCRPFPRWTWCWICCTVSPQIRFVHLQEERRCQGYQSKNTGVRILKNSSTKFLNKALTCDLLLVVVIVTWGEELSEDEGGHVDLLHLVHDHGDALTIVPNADGVVLPRSVEKISNTVHYKLQRHSFHSALPNSHCKLTFTGLKVTL